ncbi:extracellular solute-binding protein [Paenibacillus koleovorans]|uniref:extracellular solute-binding protein n=1 Tax=Paenibacillus koleovorans TaxID=121608 RepID=UPI000FDC10D3|nr:extracellular solute-binding protein [Paenibacillus koleovorans]
MKKNLIVFTVLTFTTVVLSACGSNKGTDSTVTQTPSITEGTAASLKEELNLRIMIEGPVNARLPAVADDFVKKTIEEKFNVKLTVEYMPAGQDYVNKLNAHLAANEPPDMWRDVNGDGGQKYALDGVLGEIGNFINPSKMPNYFKYWVDDTTFQRYQFQGKVFRAPTPYSKELYRTWYIRKDWLDQLNLQIPKTYDEYLNVLKAFTFNDPDGNGKKDTYGFTTAPGGDGIGLEWPEYWKAGLVYATTLQNGKFIDMQTDPRVEQALNDISKVVAEGLVDPDWFLNKSPQHIDRAAQGKVGVIMGATQDFAYDSNPQSLQSKTKALFPKANWVPFTPFGNQPIATGVAPGSPILFHKNIVEKSPEKVTRIVEILDWLASEEGFLLSHYGVENRHYTKSGKTITLNLETFQKEIVEKGDFLTIWDFFTPATPAVFGLTVINAKETDRDREIAKTIAAIPSAPYLGTSLLPPTGFDLATFRKRQRELQAKAIFDDKSGKNWPAYREELMTKYNGNALFEAYDAQIKAAGLGK